MAAVSRLSTAIADGLLRLPDGDICVVRPSASYDVSALPRDRVTICQTFFPDHAAWSAAGYHTVQTIPACQVAIVVVPRAKALARAMIASAAQNADLLIVDGYKTDGVDSLFKDARKRLGQLPTLTKDHGRIFWMTPGQTFADWAAPAPAQGDHGFYTAAGVFSEGQIDKGSAALVAALPPKMPAKMADLGAGWGFLADAVLRRKEVKTLDLIEAEALSLDCARLNISDDRARFFWDDATQFQGDKGYDGIVMNPPFHAGRASDPALGRSFIQAARRLLAPHGKLWMVANRHLPYEATLRESFRNVDEVGGNGAFKVVHATRPIR